MGIKLAVKDWQKLLVPEFTISALSIEDRIVRVFCFDKSITKINKVGQYPLPLGFIDEGVIKKPQELEAFLKSLKQKLWPKDKNVWIILSLPSSNFYTNILSLPDLEEERFKDAVIFNTQMVAPLPLEEVYFDWEDWGVASNTNERQAFIALGIKKQVDAYLKILNNLNFQVIAVEPWALSLSRFLATFGEKDKAVLTIALRNDGIEFILSENNKLIFFDFDSWKEIFGAHIPAQITVEMLQKHIDSEIPMLLNFYYLKRQKPIEKFIFISTDNQIVSVISQWLKNEYHLEPFFITLPNYLKWLSLDWGSVVGAALRALIPRYQDTIVSLAPVGTEDSYNQNRIYRITSLWSKVIMTVTSVLLIGFVLMDQFMFSPFLKRVEANAKIPLDNSLIMKEKLLIQEVDEFNALIKMLGDYSHFKKNWSDILTVLFNNASKYHININRIFVSNAPANNITIQANGTQQEDVINFKNALSDSSKIFDVNLPLESLVSTPQGLSFTINAKI